MSAALRNIALLAAMRDYATWGDDDLRKEAKRLIATPTLAASDEFDRVAAVIEHRASLTP